MIYRLDSDYYLRPLRRADINGPYATWFEDQEVCRYNSHGKYFKSRETLEAYLEQLEGHDRLVLAICHEESGHVGNVSLQEISSIDRTAEFAILLGERAHWGKGLGIKAGNALLAHGFDKLNLERIYCGTAATNMAMQKLAIRLGMSLEGTRREHLFLDGKRIDLLEYGLLRAEFNSTLP